MAAVAHPPRPQIRRNSPLSMVNVSHGFSSDAPGMKRIDVRDDSDSDDEPPPAIKFSKATQALLADAGVPSSPPKPRDALLINRSTSAGQAELNTPSREPRFKLLRHSSPSTSGGDGLKERGGNTPPRVIYLNSSKGPGSGKRSVSISGPYPHHLATNREPTTEMRTKPEVITPAPAPRAIRITRSRTGSNASQDDSGNPGSSISRPSHRTGNRLAATNDGKPASTDFSASDHQVPETISRYAPSTVNRTRNASADVAPPSGAQRMKRVPVGTTGSFFNRRPVRGGFRRRDSEEISPIDDPQTGSAQPSEMSHTPQERSTSDSQRSRHGTINARAASVEPVSVHDYAPQPAPLHGSRPSSRQGLSCAPKTHTGHDSRPGSRQEHSDFPRSRQASAERLSARNQSSIRQAEAPAIRSTGSLARRSSIEGSQPRPSLESKPPQRAPSLGRGTYRYVASKIHTDASDDQENMPPPTFKRNKDQEFKYLGKTSLTMLSDDEKPKVRMIDETPVPVSHQNQRRALGTISGNTPHRPAPAPPPKMTALETATNNGGASTTKVRKKRQHMVVNGKIFTQMGRLGRGGSSDVYCVMAENFKTFALKRVKLHDCGENEIRGFKGEIDLLKKLTEVERVVRLVDWELNEDKQELLVLMEKGDTDLNRLLTLQLNGHDARFDATFTRYQWKEMLECVQAVHKHDIVHSDLKPANFLLVSGRLKLIDFGIANAIDTDNTCNVHRDNHVGTPNYMSPESITDTSTSTRDDSGRPQKKDMRIGKSSDVWSLGCILYQMTYGRPPFAQISNQITKIMAITNPKHIIEFPETGVGNAPVPPILRGLLRKCLNREPLKRPTVDELLSDSEEFLNPEGVGAKAVMMTEVMLGHIIKRVYDRCRDTAKGLPAPEEIEAYPAGFMAKIRDMKEGA